MRVIVITGPARCGSTLFCSALSNLPGVMGVGEAHWIVDRGRDWCFRCGTGKYCPVVSPTARSASLNDSTLYSLTYACGKIIYPQLSVLVVSDKPPRVHSRFLQPHRADGVLLARRPEGFIAGWKNHPERYNPYTVLPRYYPKLLKWGREFFSRFTVVNFDHFAAYPDRQIPKICESLRLPLPLHPLGHPAPSRWHPVGGNRHTLGDPLLRSGIHPDDHWKKTLSPQDISEVRRHPGLRRTWSLLKEQAI